VRLHGCKGADVSLFTPGNFITDATVRPSHGRPGGHRPSIHPSVRPSVIVRVTTVASNGPKVFQSKIGDKYTLLENVFAIFFSTNSNCF
jgi:hypothetical protein